MPCAAHRDSRSSSDSELSSRVCQRRGRRKSETRCGSRDIIEHRVVRTFRPENATFSDKEGRTWNAASFRSPEREMDGLLHSLPTLPRPPPLSQYTTACISSKTSSLRGFSRFHRHSDRIITPLGGALVRRAADFLRARAYLSSPPPPPPSSLLAGAERRRAGITVYC